MRGAKTYNTQSVCDLPEKGYSAITRPVGQLVEVGDRGEIKHRFCTGFNILQSRYFVTAGHCTTSDSVVAACPIEDAASPVMAGKCVVNFDYKHCDVGVTDTRITGLKFVPDGACVPIKRFIDSGYCAVDATYKYDYSILELSPEAGIRQSLEFSAMPITPTQTVMLVHHPEGYPQQYSLGKVARVSPTLFTHTAHTEGGSSGAPVLGCYKHSTTGKDTIENVIGIHVRGNSAQTFHAAVPVRSIVEDAHRRKQNWVTPYLKKFGLFTAAARGNPETIFLSSTSHTSKYASTKSSSGCC